MPLTIEKAVEDYIAYCTTQKRLSRYTIYNYAGQLNHLTTFLTAQHPDVAADVSSIRLSTLRAYLAARFVGGESEGTTAARVSIVRGFCTYLDEQEEDVEFAHGNPAKKLVAPKRKQKTLRLPETQALYDALTRLQVYVVEINDIGKAKGVALIGGDAWLNTENRAHIDARNRCLVWTPLLCGPREREMAEMRWADIVLKAASPYIVITHGKGNKERKVPMPPELAALYGKLLTYEREAGRGQPGSRVFCSTAARQKTQKGEVGSLSVQMIYKIICGLLDGLWDDKPHVTPHDLRRICASELLRAGNNPRYIQYLLGHSSLAVTMRYLDVDEAAIEKAVAAAPLNGVLRARRRHTDEPTAQTGA